MDKIDEILKEVKWLKQHELIKDTNEQIQRDVKINELKNIMDKQTILNDQWVRWRK